MAAQIQGAFPPSSFQMPHRKPLPGPGHSQAQQLPVRQSSSSHSRTRTTSSSVLPAALAPGPQPAQAPPPQQNLSHQTPANINPVSYHAYMNQSQAQIPHPQRRSPSMATASTGSHSGPGVPARTNSDASSLARSASSRSGNAAPSYVALMRKQKATVWSDRAQHEDPRMRAAMVQAKMRAHMEVSGLNNGRMSSSGNSSLTGGVRSKIRYHGAVKAQQYAPTTHPASGVPMRLSAREVDESDSDEERPHSYHQRTGSGRSSLGSAGRTQSMYSMQQQQQQQPQSAAGRTSVHGSTPPQSQTPPTLQQQAQLQAQQQAQQQQRERADTRGSMWSEGAEPTPVPGRLSGPDYFSQAATNNAAGQTAGSSNSERDEASFGGIGHLPLRQRDDEEGKKLDLAELRRRGSVDERTMTMSGYGRLFVANPDSDSD